MDSDEKQKRFGRGRFGWRTLSAATLALALGFSARPTLAVTQITPDCKFNVNTYRGADGRMYAQAATWCSRTRHIVVSVWLDGYRTGGLYPASHLAGPVTTNTTATSAVATTAFDPCFKYPNTFYAYARTYIEGSGTTWEGWGPVIVFSGSCA
jgi:hypothetical protein